MATALDGKQQRPEAIRVPGGLRRVDDTYLVLGFHLGCSDARKWQDIHFNQATNERVFDSKSLVSQPATDSTTSHIGLQCTLPAIPATDVRNYLIYC